MEARVRRSPEMSWYLLVPTLRTVIGWTTPCIFIESANSFNAVSSKSALGWNGFTSIVSNAIWLTASLFCVSCCADFFSLISIRCSWSRFISLIESLWCYQYYSETRNVQRVNQVKIEWFNMMYGLFLHEKRKNHVFL